ncbi:MAG: homocysteine S-methyltransferase family protein, partial [Methanomicrobiales archaeon]|nr:homocysteine S-methyltransferase family protein [Methanomicrobiales archaeon]
EQINSTAVKLAREAREICGRDVFIAGAIGPLGNFDPRDEGAGAVFAEQARILEGRGADLFMVETFYDLDELEAAIAGVRSVSSLPIVALMSFDTDAQTLGGVTARRAAQRLSALDVVAFGANHGRGPAAALAALSEMQGEGAILAALPNVGLATMTGSRVTFPLATSEYFGEFAARARSLGAGLIGGCCGTTPTQIAAIRAAIDEGREATTSVEIHPHDIQPAHVAAEQKPTELARMLETGEFVVSVQLDPPLGGNVEALVDAARKIKESGLAQIVDVNDNPRARARMSGLMASVAIEQLAGIETVPHLTPRDSTIAGLESMLLGALAQGIRNVLAVS